MISGDSILKIRIRLISISRVTCSLKTSEASAEIGNFFVVFDRRHLRHHPLISVGLYLQIIAAYFIYVTRN